MIITKIIKKQELIDGNKNFVILLLINKKVVKYEKK